MNISTLKPVRNLLIQALEHNLFSKDFCPAALVKDPYTDDWNIRPLWNPAEARVISVIKSVAFLNRLLDDETARIEMENMTPVCLHLNMRMSTDITEIGVQVPQQLRVTAAFYETLEGGYGITTQL